MLVNDVVGTVVLCKNKIQSKVKVFGASVLYYEMISSTCHAVLVLQDDQCRFSVNLLLVLIRFLILSF